MIAGLKEALAAFGGDYSAVSCLGAGNINETFLVRQNVCGSQQFVLQRINAEVFPDPSIVIENFQCIAEHFAKRVSAAEGFVAIAQPIRTLEGSLCYYDRSGGCWRAQTYFQGYQTAVVGSAVAAGRLGRALASFHRLIGDIDITRLHNPLPGFHDLPGYLHIFDQLDSGQMRGKIEGNFGFCLRTISRYRRKALQLTRDCAAGNTISRPIHGDPKCENFLLSSNDGNVALIDLDTVGTGFLEYDLGDCLRSLANRAGEMSMPGHQISLDLELCRAFAAGYAQQTDVAASDLAESFFRGLFTITYELGLRFFTDHLKGDVYFKVAARGQNLQRAVNQFTLLENILSQERALHNLLG